MDHIKDLIETVRALKARLAQEPDPRARLDIAETLDMLEPIVDREVDRLILQLEHKAS